MSELKKKLNRGKTLAETVTF